MINFKFKEDLRWVVGKLNFIFNIINVFLNWKVYFKVLVLIGKFYIVGMVMDFMVIFVLSLINGEKIVGGSLVGSFVLMRIMFDFCVRYDIYLMVEEFFME